MPIPYQADLSTIASIYDAAMDTSRWDRALANLEAEFDCSSGQTAFRDARDRRLDYFFVRGIDPNAPEIARYFEIEDEDILASLADSSHPAITKAICSSSRLDEVRRGAAWHCREIFSESDLRDSKVYTEVREPLGFEFCMSKRWKLANEKEGMVALYRGKKGESFNSADCRRLDELGVHIKRAQEIYLQVADISRKSNTALLIADQLKLGIVVINQNMQVFYTNSLAKNIIERNNPLQMHGENLHCQDPETYDLLNNALLSIASRVEEGFRTDGGSLQLSRGDQGMPYGALLSPISDDFMQVQVGQMSMPLYALIISDPEETGFLDSQDIQLLFGLNDKQSQVASLFASGGNVKSIAQTFGTSEEAVRKHLKAIFQATDTGSQAELVNLLMRSVPMFN